MTGLNDTDPAGWNPFLSRWMREASFSDFMDEPMAMYSLVSRSIVANEYANSLFLCSDSVHDLL